ELNFEDRLNNDLAKKYYFVPLQTYSDFQVRIHSDFGSIESFLKGVILSFSKNAPKETFLLLKHHPMDRGIKNYSKLIKKLASEIGISNRVIVVSDVHLPTCLKNAIGTVTINSTVGISSLYHGAPTLTLGRACYDIDGLTCKDMKLDYFWNDFIEPDKDLFEKFRTYLIEKTQTKGSFYSRFPDDLMDKLSFDRITDTEY
ncbi:MAG: capsular biosynthesis protein, partial [bacterium]|nr:capsular biosynthesis protein [bacterium]